MVDFFAHFLARDGYGYAALKIVESLQAIGAATPVEMRINGEFAPTDGTEVAYRSDRPALMMGVPDWLPQVEAPTLLTHTMFEASKLPAGWSDLLNKHAALCIVPCEWCEEIFRDNGVTIPIKTIHWGVDTDSYPYAIRPLDRQPYTFLWTGGPDRRKGWDVAYKAFIKAFGGKDKRVKLRLHFRHPLPGASFADKNVEVIVGRFYRPELRAILYGADCFVFPSRGEGWGMPPREAAATGLPVITTNHSGLAVDIEEWAIPLGISGMSPARYGFWGDDLGQWAEPDVNHLADLMRWCFENQESAATLGWGAAAWLAENATWGKTAAGFRQLFEDVLA